mgnify:CR=1 FL=1
MNYKESKPNYDDIKSKDILSFKEAVVYLHISPSALYKLNHAHKIPYFKPNNKLVYYRKFDLDAFMLSNYQPTSVEIENQCINSLKK